MSTSSTTQPNPDVTPASNTFDEFVTRRLQRAASQVKIVDLATGMLLIATVLLGVLLAVCIVDAWVVSLGPSMRVAVLIGLFAFSVAVLVRSMAPLLIRRINPAYAARMIELGEPKFKNSLLNYVYLRTRPHRESQRVFAAVGEKAAQDLSGVSIENAIDRTQLIQIGFALVSVTLAGGMYKLLSPKDPFATIARVVAPLADIQSPSRVRVLKVDPGSVEIFFGDSLPITADIRGSGTSIPVVLVYSTEDGQRVNATIPLSPSESKNKFTGTLTTSESGIQQNLTYWVVAGDGRSPTYSVAVRPSPTITVSSIDLRPPAYTELPAQRLLGQADIDAVEGTAVHLEALANMPIASAALELLKAKLPPIPPTIVDPAKPTLNSPIVTPTPTEFDLVERLSMAANDRTASAEFKLLRSGDEQKFTHYRLKFATSDGQRNRHEQVYSVRIQPDIAPEIEVLEPTENKLQVPVNGKLSIKARALDPDFKISAIRLVAMQKGKVILEQNLPLDHPAGVGNVHGQFRLRPNALSLQPGDEIVFHLVAKDNRRSPLSDQPDPNEARSANFELTITPPLDSNQSGEGDDSETPNENQDSSSGEQSSQEKQQKDSNSSSDEQTDKSNSSGDKEPKNGGGKSSGGGESDKESKDDEEQSSSGSQSSRSSKPKSQSSNDQKSSQGGMNDQPSDAAPNAQPSDSGESTNSQPKNSQPDKTGNESSNPGQSGDKQSDAEPSENEEPAGKDENGEPMPGDSAPNSSEPQSADGSTAQNDYQDKKEPGNEPSANQQRSANDSTNRKPSNNSQPSPGEPSAKSDNPNEPSDTRQSREMDRPLDESSTEGERMEKLLERLGKEKNKSDQKSGNQNSGAEKNNNSDSEKQQSSSESKQGDDAQQPSGTDPQKDSGASDKSPDTGDSKKPDGAEAAKPDEMSDSKGAGEKPDSSDSNSQSKTDQPSDSKTDSKASDNQNPDQSTVQPSSDQPGDGSKSNDASSKESKSSESQNDANESETPSDSKAVSDSSGDSKSKPTGGDPRRNKTNQTQFPDSSKDAGNNFQPPPETPEEREHLEQSRKVTDLVLDYLKDQQHRPNTELLNEMNWTEAELRDFVQRWEKMKLDAAQGDANAQIRYAEALRSLGLPTQSEQARRARMQRDQIRDLNEDSAISRPPEKFAEAFRDFSKGRAKSGNQ